MDAIIILLCAVIGTMLYRRTKWYRRFLRRRFGESYMNNFDRSFLEERKRIEDNNH